MTLDTFFIANPRAALAFSGGCDSSLLLYEGLRRGAALRPYYVKSAFQPAFELADARRLAGELGTALSVIELDVLALPDVRLNPPERCYACKQAIFGAIQARAAADGCALLLDGTNASDAADERPGMRALRELGVRSPLREAGLTKDAVRQLSKAAGLFTWDKPAYACLATRVPTGTPLDAATLRRVEAAEDALMALGFRDFRCRVYANAARLQFRAGDMERAVREREAVLQALKPHFETVLLDLEGR